MNLYEVFIKNKDISSFIFCCYLYGYYLTEGKGTIESVCLINVISIPLHLIP